ncbi:MAG: glycoside hydrolase family 3 N-terminal domain-containing protein [Deltaproteobacteria bacterium]|nr:glycoside hydrolase family 3 N-terminal domain-containing protein [Deltaproteobacteria bacterium]
MFRCLPLVTCLSLTACAAATPLPPAPPIKAAVDVNPPQPPDPSLYKDAKASIETRVQSLLAQMTLEEKVAQTTTVWTPELFEHAATLPVAQAQKMWPHGIGLVALPIDKVPAQQHAQLANDVQRFATQNTRLGIPALIIAEALHGTQAKGATVFPQAIALGATWDRDLLRSVFTVAAAEARAVGANQVLAPVVDVAREPRFGRTEEMYGEDPYLVGELGLAAVQGFQGEGALLGKPHVAATLKHFAGHGQPEGGRNTAPANIGMRYFQEVHLWPFERITKATPIASVMASYNEVDGVPSHANRWLLTEQLRNAWGFSGYVVADLRGVERLLAVHHVVATPEDAARVALWSGVDLELANRNHTYPTLVSQINNGRVAAQTLDQAVARVLSVKFRLGLFDEPFVDPNAAINTVGAPAHAALARKAAEKALVLLKNDQLLPLDEKRIKHLAIIGPNAGSVHLGGYSVEPFEGTSIKAGLEQAAAGKFDVRYAEGVRIIESEATFWKDGDIIAADPQKNAKRIADAVKVARTADVIVLALGDNESVNREAWGENHLGDRTDLTLLGDQNKLVEALSALKKPMVVVFIGGRPLELASVASHAHAILCGFYLGQHTGEAVADALFGRINPGGKLPITFPQTSGQAPFNYDHKPSRFRAYVGNIDKPLYPFGHGLSYTTFAYGPPQLSAATIKAGQSVTVTVDVTNTGKVAGDAVAQLYLHDQVAAVTRPVKSLREFARLTLAAGESKRVSFTLPPVAFAFYGIDGTRVVEPGAFDVMVGGSSEELQSTTLTITE